MSLGREISLNISIPPRAQWLVGKQEEGSLRPYIFMRKENLIPNPGSRHHIEWFDPRPIMYFEALDLTNHSFGEAVIFLENLTFGPDLAMPRWVFWDCALVPGFVSGFAIHRDQLPDSIRTAFGQFNGLNKTEWVPISLFIIIPTIHEGEWVAHNLCTINSVLPEAERLYGLGFLTKAFGLWYANVETCIGMTQWRKPALKLHSHFGYLEVLTAYSPLHTYDDTMTYRCEISTRIWRLFFSREEDLYFSQNFCRSDLVIDPFDRDSMRRAQIAIEQKKYRFYLSPREIALRDERSVYTLFFKKVGECL
ncbi:MAG: hypothetical protein NZ480_04625 [Bdellovibrionaceae bacterium]|nr:hypothetical protein [Pseudobdellovibrionaceae bacterium]MDW8190829.1 hypothetical protein [Pseudobdellovibrionaceae bacterium]